MTITGQASKVKKKKIYTNVILNKTVICCKNNNKINNSFNNRIRLLRLAMVLEVKEYLAYRQASTNTQLTLQT